MFSGGCSGNSFQCITAYNVALFTDAVTTSDAYNTQQGQTPLDGSGDVALLHYPPSSGPFLPCGVDANGRQDPCSDDNSTASGDGPQELVLHASNMSLTVTSIGDADFAVKLVYRVTWSDRSAVHPCRINLYQSGDGVPASGKQVPSASWWVPEPNSPGAASIQTTRPTALSVAHLPGQYVREPCTVTTCLWPKQLFLEAEMHVQLTFSAAWKLSLFPFDEQNLRGSIYVASNFVEQSLRNATRLAGAEVAILGDALKRVYELDDWNVESARIFSGDQPLQLSFEVRVRRSDGKVSSVIFSVILPLVVTAFLTIASSWAGDNAISVLSLSVIAGVAFLDPRTVGLPPGSSDISFVTALAVGHLGITGFLLLLSIIKAELDKRTEDATESFGEERHKEVVQMWQQAHELTKTIADEHFAQDKKEIPLWELAKGRKGIVASALVRGRQLSRRLTSSATRMSGAVDQTNRVTVTSSSPASSPASPPPSPPTTPSSDKAYSDADMRSLLFDIGRLLVTMPTLIHHAVQSQSDTPSHPFVMAGAPQGTAAYQPPGGELNDARNDLFDRLLRYGTLPLYGLVWGIISLTFFAV